MLSRLHITLQAPAVAGQRTDIQSALIAFLHIADILVKVLTLFFTEVSTILWKIVQVRPEEMLLLTCVHQLGRNSPLIHQPNMILEISVVVKKVCNDGLKEKTGREFSRIQCIIKGRVPASIFSMLFRRNF